MKKLFLVIFAGLAIAPLTHTWGLERIDKFTTPIKLDPATKKFVASFWQETNHVDTGHPIRKAVARYMDTKRSIGAEIETFRKKISYNPQTKLIELEDRCLVKTYSGKNFSDLRLFDAQEEANRKHLSKKQPTTEFELTKKDPVCAALYKALKQRNGKSASVTWRLISHSLTNNPLNQRGNYPEIYPVTTGEGNSGDQDRLLTIKQPLKDFLKKQYPDIFANKE